MLKKAPFAIVVAVPVGAVAGYFIGNVRYSDRISFLTEQLTYLQKNYQGNAVESNPPTDHGLTSAPLPMTLPQISIKTLTSGNCSPGWRNGLRRDSEYESTYL